ncbi:MAG: hypothetical protein IKF38_04870 [Clostridia bacterium]|nr:hypothetical protein [Clostridia bacterium]
MIKVTDKYYITANTNCYTLQEKTTIKDEESKNYGQEVFKDLVYYTSLESCLKGFLTTNVREYIGRDTINTLQELIQQIRQTDNYIKSLNLKV